MCCRFRKRKSSFAEFSTLLRSSSTSALVRGKADFPAPTCLSIFMLPVGYIFNQFGGGDAKRLSYAFKRSSRDLLVCVSKYTLDCVERYRRSTRQRRHIIPLRLRYFLNP